MRRITQSNSIARHLVLATFAIVIVTVLLLTWSHLVTPILPFDSRSPDDMTVSATSAVSITPAEPATTDDLVASVTVPNSELDDGTTYTYEWYKDGDTEPYVTATTTSTMNVLDSKDTSSGQIWKCVVTASDGSLDGAATSDDEVVIHNAPPSTPEITISPSRPLNTDNIVCSIDNPSSDKDGDNIHYTYAWYMDDKLQSQLATDTVDSSLTSKGQVWKCVVTVNDGTDKTTASDEVTIGGDVPNTPPTAPAINVTPDSPDITNDLVCSITSPSSDPDGDTISYSYQWYNDDVLQDTLTSNTVDSSHTGNDQVWRCLVIASDGIDTTSSNSDQVIIARKATYYVDVNNGSDSNDGRSIGSPFRTISRAANAVQPGDVVHIREGTYYLSSSLRLTTYGTSGNPIVFEGYPGEEVILSGGMVYLTASWNTLANLQVTGSSQQGIYVFGNDNVFENIVTYDNYLSGLQIAEGDRNLLINVIAHGNYGGEHTDGIGISSGYQNTLKGCVVYDNSDDGIDTWESSDNVIENCIAYSNGYNGGDGNGFKVGPGGSNIITRCIAYNNSVNGFDTNEGAGNDIYNNTAYNNGRYNFASYYYQNTLRNNIAYSGGLSMADGPIESHNTWNLGIYDPGFLSLDPSSPDFLRLSSDSAARNAGESGVDLGALQYGQTIANLIPAFYQ